MIRCDEKRWNNIYLWQLFSTGGYCFSGEIFGCHKWKGVYYWHLVGRGQVAIEVAINMLTDLYRTSSMTNNYLIQSVNTATMEKPWSILLMIPLRMVTWTRCLIDIWFESSLPCPNAHLNLKLEFTIYISSLIPMQTTS